MGFYLNKNLNKINMSKLVAKLSAQAQLSKFMYYAKVELRPPTPVEVGQAIPLLTKGISNVTSMQFTQLPVKQALLNAMVFTEVCCWFFVGEVIGRGSLVGYDV